MEIIGRNSNVVLKDLSVELALARMSCLAEIVGEFLSSETCEKAHG